ncbi:MAG: tRNA preQ1(34) S-adenosylmethionine ribosyltransferase-isomerase QueA [Candidatus Melainabacteria bacterium]|nr:tRNA preQ1(34) S-adenosylmethionine ribosyltransferase-isomerase QueA [Candidatus Melainabacteria bacterium]
MVEDLYNLETYNYSLPKDLIAQYPLEKRDESRLLCYRKVETLCTTSLLSHCKFYELPDLLTENDVLVLNNTKVIPARFYCKTKKDKEIEILLVSPISPDNLTWKILASPKKHLIGVETLRATSLQTINVIDTETIRFQSHQDLETILNNIGETPLPPYIKRKPEKIDIDRYQTVFAKEPGAVAAPTAALHFTPELLDKIKKIGVEIFYITLHVGPGTFLPIRSNDIREHKLMPEFFYIESEVWDKILKAKKNKKRIIACGTTTVRALEYAATIKKPGGLNGLYITPNFKFQIIDALITNFHLPKTTLLVLVSTFIGWENVRKIYTEAIKEQYRFYSYGDGMIVY